jgi:hypothetical protein
MIRKIKHLPKSFKIGLFILVLISGAYVSSWALGYGQNNNRDGLVLDMTLSSDYYNSGTKTFSDQSGNNNHGVSANNVVFLPDKDGKSEGAMRFNGSTDFVNMGNSSIYDLQSAGTVSVWVKIPSTWQGATYPNLVSKGASAGWDTNGWSLYVFSNNQIGVGMRNGSSTSIRQFTNTIKDQWTHIVGIWDGTTIRIYQDGVLKASGAQGSVPGTNTNNVFIGRGPTAHHFGGEVAGVKIYNRAFSTAEVQKLYGDSKPKIQASSLEKGLVGYWPLDGDNYNANTNRVTDKSAYSNHSTNYGATLTEDRFGRAGGAMGFDGISDIRIGNNTHLNFNNNSNFTMSLWVKKSANPVNGNVVGLFGTISGSNRFGIDYYFVGNKIRAGIRNSVNGQKSFEANPVNSLNDWNHISFVYESEKSDGMKIYINGILAATSSNIGFSDFSSSAVFTLGSNFGIGGSPVNFLGDMSEARIYNRALSASEVKSLYERDAPKISASSLQKGLVLDMPLTSQYTKGGGVILDKSAYSNHGQNYGANITNEGAIFNASSYIQINNPINQSNLNQEWTVSAWVNIGDTGSSQLLISGLNHGLSLTHATTNRALLYLNSGDNDYYVYSNSVNLLANQGWKHVVFTFRNSDGYRKIYINGEDKTGSGPNKTSTPSGLSSLFRIGQLSQGTISGVRIYNRVLSLTEIKSLYDQGRGETEIILGGN